MRQKIKAGPDHGVTRDQVAELLDGLNGTQLRAVATASGIDVSYLQRTKGDVANLIVRRTVGDLLDHHAITGYEGQLAPWASKPKVEAGGGTQPAGAATPTGPDPTAPAAVSRWNADQGRMDY